MNTTHAEKVINEKHLQAAIGSIPVRGIKRKTEDTNNSITTLKRLKQTNNDTPSVISGLMIPSFLFYIIYGQLIHISGTIFLKI